MTPPAPPLYDAKPQGSRWSARPARVSGGVESVGQLHSAVIRPSVQSLIFLGDLNGKQHLVGKLLTKTLTLSITSPQLSRWIMITLYTMFLLHIS